MKDNSNGKEKFVKRLVKLLLKMGFNPSLIGFNYLVESVIYAFTHQVNTWKYVKDLYPSVGKIFNTNGSNVERCIRNLIEALWNNNHLDDTAHALGLYKLYTNERLSNSEMISLLAKFMAKHFIYINGKFIPLDDYDPNKCVWVHRYIAKLGN